MIITGKHFLRGLDLYEVVGWHFSSVPLCDDSFGSGQWMHWYLLVSFFPKTLISEKMGMILVWSLFYTWHKNFKTIRIIPNGLFHIPTGLHLTVPSTHSLHLLWPPLPLLSEQNPLAWKPIKGFFCLISKGMGCQMCSQTQDRVTICLFTFLGEEPKSLK